MDAPEVPGVAAVLATGGGAGAAGAGAAGAGAAGAGAAVAGAAGVEVAGAGAAVAGVGGDGHEDASSSVFSTCFRSNVPTKELCTSICVASSNCANAAAATCHNISLPWAHVASLAFRCACTKRRPRP